MNTARDIAAKFIPPPQRAGYDAFGYRAATYARESGLTTSTGTEDYNLRWDRELLVDLGRTMFRDNWLVKGCGNRGSDYILGPTGFTLQAKSGVDGTNRKIEKDLFPAWAEEPEVRGMFDWPMFQALVLRECWIAGDQGLVKYGLNAPPELAGRYQHIEAERITSSSGSADNAENRVEQGVVLNKVGRPVAYKIADVDSYGYTLRTPAREIPAANFLYVGSPFERSSQTRCAPLLCSSFAMAHRLDDILTSCAVAWQVQSRLVAKIIREKHKNRATFRSGVNAGNAVADETTRASTLISEVGPALIFQGQPGDELEPFQQNRPQPDLEKHVLTFVRLFCVPIGLPAEVLLQFWPQFNYSSGRIVLLQAFIMFRRWQQHMVRRFYVPTYRWHINRWVAQGKLAWRPGIYDHEWNVPSWPWIDEDKEVGAWAKKIDRCIATQTQALKSLGLDPDEQRQQRKGEILSAWKVAKEIEKDTDGEIKAIEIYRHLAGLESGKTEAAVRAASSSDASNPSDPPNMPDMSPQGDSNDND